jgi:protoheme IX farnesyltransferase
MTDENIFLKRLKAYYELTKPKTVWLLVFVGVIGGLIHLREDYFRWSDFLLGTVFLTLSVAGTNAFTCWIDRDIDSIMTRTSGRPIPKGELTPRAALLFSITTFLIGVFGAVHLKPVSVYYLLLGFLFSAVIYNGYLKRRSPLNVLFASPAGMMPVLFMWSFIKGSVDYVAILLGLLVVGWTPAHIWSLTLIYREDYERANVPMLPVVRGERETIRWITAGNFFLVLITALLVVYGKFGPVFTIPSAFLNAVLFYLSFKTSVKPTKENAYKLFKFSSPYLALIFLFALLDRFIR